MMARLQLIHFEVNSNQDAAQHSNLIKCKNVFFSTTHSDLEILSKTIGVVVAETDPHHKH